MKSIHTERRPQSSLTAMSLIRCALGACLPWLLGASSALAQGYRSIDGAFEAGSVPEVLLYAPQAYQVRWIQLTHRLQDADTPEVRAKLFIERGHLWRALYAPARAYHDFVAARDLLVKSDAPASQMAEQVLRYIEQLDRRSNQYRPVPQARDAAANLYWGLGYHAYWTGDHAEADAQFQQAQIHFPHEPASYYYRALLAKRTGDMAFAESEARKGAYWEYQLVQANAAGRGLEAVAYLERALERVQGTERLWLESRRISRAVMQPASPEVRLQRAGHPTATGP